MSSNIQTIEVSKGVRTLREEKERSVCVCVRRRGGGGEGGGGGVKGFIYLLVCNAKPNRYGYLKAMG